MRPLTADLLLRAYASGVFPMARSRDENRLYWVDPEQRGILPLEAFHVPKSLRRTLRSERFDIRCDTAFEAVMRACGEATADRPETWINEQIIRLFVELFELGLGHSVEVWQDGELVGGLYGLALGAAFFGESMFSRRTDASKVALVHLVARLRHGGFRLLDTQFVTEHLKQFGAQEISRAAYQDRLADALAETAWFDRNATVAWEVALV
ncbi:leucyl/phenylalanyl-tRNA--protein transferase [Paramagnetospirillum magneticum]|uniref:Leucyl/phenylalanyl-tRNA--protein transferase n=1 Tax=Paramagnetospirillum magneticum (strain ATCC 700264 / AMB-1) TaxID=342108 RepID=LFTR_PARM1|nr:leucyl/phenylalanyl-tRNA--protein transferase [Paramagnetospirillum magneticum]Q2W3N1.1 RecName: Full=Leucyl/phenylalanyl-tRNA--protein transferase; AltName: Full=L/F-transferase; AltName: Full=Leucyltransferase; AltName: Full=Phenyalanyltransferase [Paramagnetospirillum magneticum AMB-1]BAE51544.1 Leu/Phe-tRNA-protein transferase [Paramagnetospirillum magneticum AMB-1]